ncbi:MAG: tetratricopeptide repeat protein, partial [Chloroflexi bacterium]|nr:tetratricopeptide repeat protein [Chloroflexota bacterium]
SLLGQACLESNRPDDAADMFRRVLGVDPQNFVARVGLGVVADGIGATEEAIWQLERALELEPNHPEVRQELLRLRAPKGTDASPQRVKPTRAALGYTYMRGEWFEQAAEEFRAVLEQEDGARDRFDAQVALAEALYRAGHPREAIEVSQTVLEALPNALKPTLILAALWNETGLEADANLLFERAQSLDPENTVAAQLLVGPLPLPPVEATIEEPTEDALYPPDPAVTGHAPDWLRALREPTAAAPAVEAPEAEAISKNQEPDWLKSLREPPTAPAEQRPDAPVLSAPVESEPAPLELPSVEVSQPSDWLSQLRDQPTQTTGAAEVEPERPARPGWLDDEVGTAAGSGEGETTTSPETGPVPARLKPDDSGDADKPAIEDEPAASSPMPTWLRDLTTSTTTAETDSNVDPAFNQSAPATPPGLPPLPSWLAELPEAQATADEPLPRPASVPRWMDELDDQVAVPGESVTAASEPLVSDETVEPGQLVSDKSWVAEMQSAAVPETVVPRAEPVVEEESLEHVLPDAEAMAESSAAPVVDEAMMAETESAPATVDLEEAIAYYQSLMATDSPFLPQEIDELQWLVQQHPAERRARVVLADALSRAGRFEEAVQHYRQLV